MLSRLNQAPKRILMTVDAVGGVWQYALGLAAELRKSANTLLLAGLGPEPDPEQRREAEAIAALTWLKTPPEWLAGREEEVGGLNAELDPLLHDHAIDIVHLNAPAQADGLSTPCPVVAVSHSCATTWFRAVRGSAVPEGWSWQEARNRRGFERADIAVAPSASHAAMLDSCYGGIPRLSVVHNAVAAGLESDRRENIVLAAGRWWDEGKNATILDEAAALISWPLFVAGPTTGPNGQAARFHSAMAMGPLANDELRRHMARCGIFVSPSIYEPFGLAALEAATAGTPLVLADIATYRELWDGAALFFAPKDAAALARIVNALVSDASQRRRLGQAARRRSRMFTLSRQAAAMSAIYDQAAAVFAEGR